MPRGPGASAECRKLQATSRVPAERPRAEQRSVSRGGRAVPARRPAGTLRPPRPSLAPKLQVLVRRHVEARDLSGHEIVHPGPDTRRKAEVIDRGLGDLFGENALELVQ